MSVELLLHHLRLIGIGGAWDSAHQLVVALPALDVVVLDGPQLAHNAEALHDGAMAIRRGLENSIKQDFTSASRA